MKVGTFLILERSFENFPKNVSFFCWRIRMYQFELVLQNPLFEHTQVGTWLIIVPFFFFLFHSLRSPYPLQGIRRSPEAAYNRTPRIRGIGLMISRICDLPTSVLLPVLQCSMLISELGVCSLLSRRRSFHGRHPALWNINWLSPGFFLEKFCSSLLLLHQQHAMMAPHPFFHGWI